MKSWTDLFVMLLLTMGITAGVYFLPSGQPVISEEPPAETSESEEILSSPAEMLYGIPVSSFQITRGKVRWGESLAELLLPYGISSQKIHSISQLSDTLIDERRISSGNSFSIFSTNDTTPIYFVYEKDPLNYVVIHLASDSIWAENGQKTIEKRLRIASGTITSSLWESMHDANSNPMLAIELSEIFAWSIDFFGLQPGRPVQGDL